MTEDTLFLLAMIMALVGAGAGGVVGYRRGVMTWLICLAVLLAVAGLLYFLASLRGGYDAVGPAIASVGFAIPFCTGWFFGGTFGLLRRRAR